MDERIGALCAAAVLAACGGGGGGGGGEGCAHAELAVCFEGFYAPPGSSIDRDALRQGCVEGGGVWEACKPSGRAGTCAVSLYQGGGVTAVFYPGAICFPDEGEQVCQDTAEGLGTAVFTAGLATCGAGTDQTLACDMAASRAQCSTVSGSIAPERAAVLQNLCTLDRGTPGTSCTTAGLVATCQWSGGGGLTEVEFYYPAAYLPTAEAQCAALQGTWTLF